MMIQTTQISHGALISGILKLGGGEEELSCDDESLPSDEPLPDDLPFFDNWPRCFLAGDFVVGVVFAGVVELLKDNGAKVVAFGVVPWIIFFVGAERIAAGFHGRVGTGGRSGGSVVAGKELRRLRRSQKESDREKYHRNEGKVTCAPTNAAHDWASQQWCPRARRRLQFVDCWRSCFQTGCRVRRSASARTCNSTSQPSRRIRKSR